MNKERNAILNNATVFFDKDVTERELNVLFKDFQGDIIINGNLVVCNEELDIKCDNLYITGDLLNKAGTTIKIIGNLWVEGIIDIYDININGSLYSYCQDTICTYEITVSEDVFVTSDTLDTYRCDISVGGNLICTSIWRAGHIRVLGKMYTTESVEAIRIQVG